MIVQTFNMNWIIVTMWVWLQYIVFTSAVLQETLEVYRPESEAVITQQNKSEVHSRLKRENVKIGEKLYYTNSKVYAKQIAIINTTAQVAVIIDALGEKVAILNGETGRGVIIDKVLRMGVVVNKGGWQLMKQDMRSYVADISVASLMSLNAQYSFNVDDKGTDLVVKTEGWLNWHLSVFGDELVEKLANATGDYIEVLMEIVESIIHPLKNVLGPVLDMAAKGWATIKCGLIGLVNIFQWFGKLIACVVGGFPTLIASAVLFPLVAILTAVDGARAFFCILKVLAMRFNLMGILSKVLCVPKKIICFIAGVGGLLARGVSGIFSLLSCLFSRLSGIAASIKGFIDTLIRYFGSKRPTQSEVTESVDELLSIAPAQEEQYNTDFGEYKNVLSAVKGSGNYRVAGVGIGNMVKLLTDEKITEVNQVVGVLDATKSVMSMNRAMPQLLIGMVRMLNTTNGASYIENIMPSVKIPEEALSNVKNNLLGAALRSASINDDYSITNLRSLPAPELLRRLPVVSAIYRELDLAVQKYDNSTLDDMLINNSISDELVEVTTEALQMPVS